MNGVTYPPQHGGKSARSVYGSREIFMGKYRLRWKHVAIRRYLSDVLFPLIKTDVTLHPERAPNKTRRRTGVFCVSEMRVFFNTLSFLSFRIGDSTYI